MNNGTQLLGLLLLSSALTLPEVAVAQDAEEDLQVENDIPDVSVPGGAIIVTGRRNRDVTRSSTQVISVLSQEQIARTGDGDIAGALAQSFRPAAFRAPWQSAISCCL